MLKLWAFDSFVRPKLLRAFPGSRIVSRFYQPDASEQNA
jgi:hypothetical protein